MKELVMNKTKDIKMKKVNLRIVILSVMLLAVTSAFASAS